MTTLSKFELDALNLLCRVDWTCNRAKVNTGIGVVERHIDHLEATCQAHPEVKWVIEELKARVDKRQQNKSAKAGMVAAKDQISKIGGDIWEVIKEEADSKATEYGERSRMRVGREAGRYAEFLSAKKQLESEYQGRYIDPVTRQGLNVKLRELERNMLGGWVSSYSRAHSLYNDLDALAKYVAGEKRMILESERAKVDKLVYKVLTALGTITTYSLGVYTNSTLSIVVDTEEEKQIAIALEIIPAGGYNIQKFHYRWLAKFTKNGKRYQIKQS